MRSSPGNSFFPNFSGKPYNDGTGSNQEDIAERIDSTGISVHSGPENAPGCPCRQGGVDKWNKQVVDTRNDSDQPEQANKALCERSGPEANNLKIH